MAEPGEDGEASGRAIATILLSAMLFGLILISVVALLDLLLHG